MFTCNNYTDESTSYTTLKKPPTQSVTTIGIQSMKLTSTSSATKPF